MAAYTDLYIDRSCTFSVTVNLKDLDGSALDITGYDVRSKMARSTLDVATRQPLTITILDAPTGMISLSLTDTETSTLKLGRWLFDVEIESPSGIVTRALEGQIEVRAAATQ